MFLINLVISRYSRSKPFWRLQQSSICEVIINNNKVEAIFVVPVSHNSTDCQQSSFLHRYAGRNVQDWKSVY